MLTATEVYGDYTAKNGVKFTLRSLRAEDLGDVVRYVNSFVEERERDPELGVIFDRRVTREEEADWLARLLSGVETGSAVSVAAFTAGGELVANGDVFGGTYEDERHHGKLGITVSREYRDLGIGTGVVARLVALSRAAGLKTLELEVFANNPRAFHVYQKCGFELVGVIPKKIYRCGRFIDIILMAMVL